MFIEDYFSIDGDRVSFTREQGSDFAKGVADDFNPLHDVDFKRFCIPGDLLFAVVLARYGISMKMEFVFTEMVSDSTVLLMPEPGPVLDIRDAEGRSYLHVTRRGETSNDPALIENLVRSYVEFSGHTFPHILEPLLAEKNVMINPARPLVVYQSMAIQMQRLDRHLPNLRSDTNTLEIDGKRGSVAFAFTFEECGDVVGHGQKHMLLGGLREYDKAAMTAAIDHFAQRKQQFRSE